MPRGEPNKKNTASTEEELPFEEALTQLERIVEAMESDDLPLDALLAQYEKGMNLNRICHLKLEQAELKIQALEELEASEQDRSGVSEMLKSGDSGVNR